MLNLALKFEFCWIGQQNIAKAKITQSYIKVKNFSNQESEKANYKMEENICK